MSRDAHELIKIAKAALSAAGLTFDSAKQGRHLTIYLQERTVDFWPTTGDWRVVGAKRNNGLQKFLDYVELQRSKTR